MNVIRQAHWAGFLDEFTRQFGGRRTTVAVWHGHGWQTTTRPMALAGLSIRRTGDGTAAIRIAGDAAGRWVSHSVEQPLYVRRAPVGDGQVGLVIEPSNGPRTLVRIWPDVGGV